MATVSYFGLFPAPFFDGLCPRIVESQDIVLTSENTTMFGGDFAENSRLNAWMTLEQATAFVWRVKSWKTVHSSFTSYLYEDEVVTKSNEFEQIFQSTKVFSFPSENPINESQLVCGLRSPEFGNGVLGFNAGSFSYHPPTNSFRPDMFMHLRGGGFQNFYPSIFDPFGLTDDLLIFFGEVGSITLQIGAVGYNQSLPVYGYFVRTAVSSSFNQTIVPNEYWPYDPEDGGGPIYDSITGEQLRDF